MVSQVNLVQKAADVALNLPHPAPPGAARPPFTGAARRFAKHLLDLLDPQQLTGCALEDLLRCESDQGGSNLRGLELYR